MTAAVIVLAATLAASIALVVLLGAKLVAAQTAAREAQDFATQAVRERDACVAANRTLSAELLDHEDQLDAVTTQRNTLANRQGEQARAQVATADDPYAAANELLAPLRARGAEVGPAAAHGDGEAEPADVRPAVEADGPAYRSRT